MAFKVRMISAKPISLMVWFQETARAGSTKNAVRNCVNVVSSCDLILSERRFSHLLRRRGGCQ